MRIVKSLDNYLESLDVAHLVYDNGHDHDISKAVQIIQAKIARLMRQETYLAVSTGLDFSR